ncbi:ATP-binding protein [Streptomyces armeniacus]|uniref:ATP-binding protein n=1 Tax=Streptomyces armeniacus TaxID=83291 RepID=A0A345XW44_9ACTN|nr:ATP-binding protein [Streptomyces armeniacus]AXK35860.1 ATP-binding protein [Streptomyces armeniacus]
MTTLVDKLFRIRLAGIDAALPVSAARHYVRTTLESWHISAAGIDDAVLVAGELVTNALIHVGGDITLTLSTPGDNVLIEVQDAQPGQVHAPPPELCAESGRGLHIVAALATDHGCRPGPHAKVMWAQMTPR